MANKPKIKSKKPRYVICASGGGAATGWRKPRGLASASRLARPRCQAHPPASNTDRQRPRTQAQAGAV